MPTTLPRHERVPPLAAGVRTFTTGTGRTLDDASTRSLVVDRARPRTRRLEGERRLSRGQGRARTQRSTHPATPGDAEGRGRTRGKFRRRRRTWNARRVAL